LRLVADGVLTIEQLVEKMTCNPSNILGLERGTLKKGAIADITVINPDFEWTVEADKLLSKSKNSPFLQSRMKGKAVATILSGAVVNTNA
jgi:dihydroorotase